MKKISHAGHPEHDDPSEEKEDTEILSLFDRLLDFERTTRDT